MAQILGGGGEVEVEDRILVAVHPHVVDLRVHLVQLYDLLFLLLCPLELLPLECVQQVLLLARRLLLLGVFK